MSVYLTLGKYVLLCENNKKQAQACHTQVDKEQKSQVVNVLEVTDELLQFK